MACEKRIQLVSNSNKSTLEPGKRTIWILCRWFSHKPQHRKTKFNSRLIMMETKLLKISLLEVNRNHHRPTKGLLRPHTCMRTQVFRITRLFALCTCTRQASRYPLRMPLRCINRISNRTSSSAHRESWGTVQTKNCSTAKMQLKMQIPSNIWMSHRVYYLLSLTWTCLKVPR